MKTIRQKNIPIANIVNYIVTGKKHRSNTNFKPMVYNSLVQACMINLWRGSVWAKMDTGKRILIKRVYN